MVPKGAGEVSPSKSQINTERNSFDLTLLFDQIFIMFFIPNTFLTPSGDLPTSREVRGEVVGGSQGTWECLEVRINHLCCASFIDEL